MFFKTDPNKPKKEPKNIQMWHTTFAFFPTQIGTFDSDAWERGNEGWAWLCKIEQRYTGWLTGRDGERIWEYRLIKK